MTLREQLEKLKKEREANGQPSATAESLNLDQNKLDMLRESFKNKTRGEDENEEEQDKQKKPSYFNNLKKMFGK